jgi:lysophospholipase L1-like esterase
MTARWSAAPEAADARAFVRRRSATTLAGFGASLGIGLGVAWVLLACDPGAVASPATAGSDLARAEGSDALGPAASGPRDGEARGTAASAPSTSDAIRAAREVAQRRMLHADDALQPDLPPLGEREPSGMPGHFVPVLPAKPRVDPLIAYYEALDRLQDGGELDGKVRLAFYGASGTASDLWTGYVRAYLQARFGSGGPGFVSLVPHTKWSNHSDVVQTASKHWEKHHPQLQSARLEGASSHFGWGLVTMRSATPGAWAELRPTKKNADADFASIEIWALSKPGGGSFEVYVDGASQGVVATDAPAPTPTYHGFEASPGPHTLRVELRGDGEVELFGAVIESSHAGVVLDTLGFDGARGSAHLAADETTWAEHLKHRAPDLFVLSYGSNESKDETEPLEQYRERYRQVLARFRRQAPGVACVVAGPADYPRVETDGIYRRPRLDEIIAVQEVLAREAGCGFWPARDFMGGVNSMAAWVAHDPPLGRSDHLHMTRHGYVRMGMALSDALMVGYDSKPR